MLLQYLRAVKEKGVKVAKLERGHRSCGWGYAQLRKLCVTWWGGRSAGNHGMARCSCMTLVYQPSTCQYFHLFWHGFVLRTAERSNYKQKQPWVYQKPPQNIVKSREAQEERAFVVLAGSGGAAEEEPGAKERAGAVWGLVVEPEAESWTMSQSPMTPVQDH